MVHFPHAQGACGQAAKPSQTTYWLTCLREWGVDKDLSGDASSLVGRATALPVDEST